MPRIITPAVLERMPPGFPLLCTLDDTTRMQFLNLSDDSRLSLVLYSRSRRPGENPLEATVTAAREWIVARSRNVALENAWTNPETFRGQLRIVRDHELRQRRSRIMRGQEYAQFHDDGMQRDIGVDILPPAHITHISEWRFHVRWNSGIQHGSLPAGELQLGWFAQARSQSRITPFQPLRPHMWRDSTVSTAQNISLDIAPEPVRAPSPENRGRSAYDNRPAEVALTHEQASILDYPLRSLLAKGGRVWSAEVEIDHLSPGSAARLLGVQTGSYSVRPETPSVVAASDSSVDAEIKISCMRDGSPGHADLAESTYRRLKSFGALARENTGHHVHVDGTRLADNGTDRVLAALWVATQIAAACKPTLMRLCSSGFNRHRGYGATQNFATSPSGLMSKSAALHGQRVYAAASHGGQLTYSGATMEFRMPNGTLEPVRAHAYVAIALALLDLGERAILDEEPQALEVARLAEERIMHARYFDENLGAQFMRDHFAFSEESLAALAVTAWTSSTASPEHRGVWRERQTLIQSDSVFV